MQFLIQSSGMSFDALDRNVEPLLCALNELNITKHAIGVVPFTDIITGIEDIHNTEPTIFYGSTRLVELALNTNFNPGVFYDPLWFDPMTPIGKRPDLLNEEFKYSTIGELRSNWISKPVFIKSVDPKVLTGMVLEGPDNSWWMEEYAHLKEDDRIVIGDVKPISQEWRFFIVKGKVVTGSQYKHLGCRWMTEPIAQEVWEMAHEMAKLWLPHETVVMDVCLSDNKFKVLEFNCINASGGYKSEWNKIVKALVENYG